MSAYAVISQPRSSSSRTRFDLPYVEIAETFAHSRCASNLLSGMKRRLEGVVEHPDAKRGRMDALKAAARPAPRALSMQLTCIRFLLLSAVPELGKPAAGYTPQHLLGMRNRVFTPSVPNR